MTTENNKNNEIMLNRPLFNAVVYTPLSEALKILEERRKDPVLKAKISELLKGDIPSVFSHDKPAGVQFRQIATPNFEARSFISITKDNNLETVFFEYFDDKFTSNNDFKHSLAQIHIHGKPNKHGEFHIEKETIVDFNKYNGKKLSETLTHWGESLKDFHKNLFAVYNLPCENFHFFEASKWFKNNGGIADSYYKNFFLLFVCHGILFENFLLSGSDGEFSKNIVLPSIEYVVQATGFRPLIVPIPPMDMEMDEHWISHEEKIKKLIKK